MYPIGLTYGNRAELCASVEVRIAASISNNWSRAVGKLTRQWKKSWRGTAFVSTARCRSSTHLRDSIWMLLAIARSPVSTQVALRNTYGGSNGIGSLNFGIARSSE